MSERWIRKIELYIDDELIGSSDKLSFEFEINFTNKPEPNQSTIKIYNLNRSNRAEFLKKYKKIKLIAGYENDSAIIISADIISAIHTRTPPDYITELKLGDNQEAYDTAFFSKSYAAGVNSDVIITDILDNSKVQYQFNKGLGKNVPNSRCEQLSGKDALTKYCKEAGYQWSSHNGKIEVWQKDKPINNIKSTISAENGAIDSIEKTDKGVKFKTLLDHELRPQQKITLESDKEGVRNDVAGDYIVVSAKFTGSTFSNDYFTEIEAENSNA